MTTPENITDYNALDNTTAGRAIQAGFIFAALSVPDYVPTRAGRVSTIAALAVANLVTVAAFNAFDEDPNNDLTTLVRESADADEGKSAGVAQTWGILAGVLGIGAVSLVVGERLAGFFAGQLRRRGITKPYTVVGAAAAGVAFATMELQARA